MQIQDSLATSFSAEISVKEVSFVMLLNSHIMLLNNHCRKSAALNSSAPVSVMQESVTRCRVPYIS